MNTITMSTAEPGAISRAAEILRNGGLVAFPTETVYGLGADALDPEASSRIYAAKGRPSDNPLIVHIAEKRAVYALAESVPETAQLLMEAFWPGPLTIILKKKEIVPNATTGGLSTVAIRMPSHPAAMEMIRESGVYVAAPSANRSGRPSPTEAHHVEEDLSGEIDMILDGGPVGIGIESTIVDLTGELPMILRPGFITKVMLEGILGTVLLDPSLTAEADVNAMGTAETVESIGVESKRDNNSVNGTADSAGTGESAPAGKCAAGNPAGTVGLDLTQPEHPKAPGMRYTHYAPRGELTIVSDAEYPVLVTKTVVKKIRSLAETALAEGFETAVLTTGENAADYAALEEDPHFHLILLGDTDDGQTVAAHLYGALRVCDEMGCERIYSENFRRDALGSAIMNRLVKAAGHRVIRV